METTVAVAIIRSLLIAWFLLGAMGRGFFGGDPFGFDMFDDMSDPFSLAGPSLFVTSTQPHSV